MILTGRKRFDSRPGVLNNFCEAASRFTQLELLDKDHEIDKIYALYKEDYVVWKYDHHKKRVLDCDENVKIRKYQESGVTLDQFIEIKMNERDTLAFVGMDMASFQRLASKKELFDAKYFQDYNVLVTKTK